MVITDTDIYNATTNPTGPWCVVCYHDYAYEPSWEPSIKELIRIDNAAKATEIMIMIAREFRPPVYDLRPPVNALTHRRTLFSVSGRLSNKVRRMRKSRFMVTNIQF